MKNPHYKKTQSRNPARSLFDLSYEKFMTADLGYLYPVMCDEVVPGDFIQLGAEAILRMMPMVAPLPHEINMYVHYFFVPYRILWNAEWNGLTSQTGTWEEFISGGYDGADSSAIPKWDPSDTTIGTLWDYLGFPTTAAGALDPAGCHPIDFPRRAYNVIYGEYYMDQNLQLTEDTILEEVYDNTSLKRRNWEKGDYFVSALPWQQRGTSPSLPIAGTSSATWDSAYFSTNAGLSANMAIGSAPIWQTTAAAYTTALQTILNDNEIDLSSASTFDIADLRLAFQIQRWLEANARSGVRYTEFLKAHFGVSPRDDRLQRPEYIGGMKMPVIVSEVLQTESSDASTPQGNLAGHGIGVSQKYCGKYNVQEFGLIMGIMSIMPKLGYASQGINKQWLRDTKYDFYFPEFANLSEQAILNCEIFVTDGNQTTNETIFGYQGRYNEMRSKENMVCGLMRTDFDYWHLNRIFASVPTLNSSFVTCTPDTRFLAAETEPACMVRFGNLIKAYRPMPVVPEPGYIDH